MSNPTDLTRRPKVAATRSALLVALLACLVALPAATAATTDRVQVGREGQNATAGYPLGLFTSVTLLPDYRALGQFDGESRNWQGPNWGDGSLGGKTTLDWQVSFGAAGSAAAAAAKALAQAWPVAERPRVRIPHRIGRRTVGSIPAVALLTKAPGDNNAQYESVVAFPLCRGLFVTAKFSLLNPVAEYATDPSDLFLVKGVPTRQWNHDRALAALGRVALEGYLPPGRVTGRAAGRTVTGTVRDCRGDAMAAIDVRLLRGSATVARTKASADGSYRLTAPGSGTYRVTVALTVTGKGGSATRRDVRSATVHVR